MTASRSGQPVVQLLDLLGRRWSLRILWEIRELPAQTFRQLQESAGGLSSSVLRDRLGELTQAGIVTHGGQGYDLTTHGVDLVEQLVGLDDWARRWARRGRVPRA